MEELRQTASQDAVSLQMENELLLFEIRHVRAQLASAERRWQDKVRRKNEQLRIKERKLKRAGKRIARLERARGDLMWLLQRLDSSPLRHLFRRWSGFRRLIKTYGTTE